MKWRSFFAGFGIATVIVLAVGDFLLIKMDKSDVDVVMPNSKSYIEISDQAISFHGRLDKLYYKNNLYTVICYKNGMYCQGGTLDQIGPHQVSDINFENYKIEKWTSDLVIANMDNNCYKVTLNIHRKSQLIENVRTNLKTSEPCDHVFPSTEVFTVR